MSGMSLQTGINGRGSASYTPMTPGAANPSTAGSTIAQKAYGISGTGAGAGPTTAAFGSVSIGALALAALVFLWWSLPR
jgi:hypothetical protein